MSSATLRATAPGWAPSAISWAAWVSRSLTSPLWYLRRVKAARPVLASSATCLDPARSIVFAAFPSSWPAALATPPNILASFRRASSTRRTRRTLARAPSSTP